MGLFKPDPPTPPNPYQTAAAQTGTNVSTGVANAFLNNVNQNTPQGSLSYDVTGSYSWTDPSTGQTYSIPRFTSTQTQTPQAAAIEAQNNATKLNLATMGNQQSARVSGLLSQPFTPTAGAPTAGDASSITNVPGAKTSYDPGGDIQSQFGDAGSITNSYGPADNFSADRQRVEDSLMQRMNPQLAKERASVEQRLADQGIRYGSQAYSSAMDDYNRQANDARFAAVGQAGSEQQRMNDMAAKQAGFENAAQQQAYDQALGRGTFSNAAQSQQNAQNAGQASFYNSGVAQQLAQAQSGFNASNSERNQYLQEQYQQRNQPLNEINALSTGSQVQAPNWLNSPQSQIATTDIGGMINQNFQQQMGVYNTQNQNAQQLMGGILGLGAGIIKSDRREKENIKPIGTVFSINENKASERAELPMYEYSYKDDPASERRVGPMAQDVEKLDRGAVRSIRGVKHIDGPRVMGSIMRAA